jgi:O-antigen ligase
VQPAVLPQTSLVARQVVLAPLATVLAGVRAVVARPALLVAATIVLVCVPTGGRDLATAVHVTPADIGSAALVAAVTPRVLAGQRLVPSGLWAALAGVVLAAGLATLTSPDVGTSVTGFVRYLQLFVVVPVAVALALRDRRDVTLVCTTLLAVALAEGVLGTYQYVTGTGASFNGEGVRAVGTFGAQDIMGMSTVVGYALVVAVGLAIALRGRARLALAVVAVLLVLPLLLSLSRGAVVATVGAVMAALFVAGRHLVPRVAVFATAAVVVLIGLSGDAGAVVTARVASIVNSVTDPDGSVSDRYALWETATDVWRDHPLTGVGPKMFPAYRDAYAPMNLSASSDVADPRLGFTRQPLLTPHNMYLLVLSEQGLIGAVAFATFLLGLMSAAWRRTRDVAVGEPPDGRRPDGRLVSVAAVGIVVTTGLTFVSSDIGGPSSVLMSVLIGLALWWAIQPVSRPGGGARP